VAIVAVVATHVNDLLEAPDDQALLQRVIYAVVQNGTVLFLFIAGFLFQHLSDDFSYRRYLRSKLTNVIVPYLVMSVPLLVYQRLTGTGVFAAGGPGLLGVVTAAQLPAPYWFIPMIAILYLAAPLLLALDRRPRAYWVLPPLLVAAMLCHRPIVLTHELHALIYFAPTYIAGMWLSRFRDQVLGFVDRALVPLIAACAAGLAVEVLVQRGGGAVFSVAPFSMEHGIVDVDLPVKLVASFVLVALLRRFDAEVRAPLAYLAGASFGVFFVHRQILEVLARAADRADAGFLLRGALGFVVLVPVATALSVGVVWIARRVLGRFSRYVVGC
jgi:surface polysaccharide O-acyltransferase-like enzyme